MKRFLDSFLNPKNNREKKKTTSVPLDGFLDSKNDILYVNYLSDEELEELNTLLPWKAFVADSNGRRFGNMAWAGKRITPQPVPDPRHALLSDRILLTNKTVLEIGCFEGIHTVSLCRLAGSVIAIDSRIENVLKTIIRCNLFGQKPTVFKCDVEKWDTDQSWLKCDVCHHIGVLYHLKDPVGHLMQLAELTSEAIFLDTHIAALNDPLDEYVVKGQTYRFKKYAEHGKKDVFSGMYDHAKWLSLEDLKKALTQSGFKNIELIEERNERNGLRILLLAKKK
jgi:hypothetical protein